MSSGIEERIKNLEYILEHFSEYKFKDEITIESIKQEIEHDKEVLALFKDW